MAIGEEAYLFGQSKSAMATGLFGFLVAIADGFAQFSICCIQGVGAYRHSATIKIAKMLYRLGLLAMLKIRYDAR